MEQLEARQLLAAEFLVNDLTPRIQTSSLAGTAVDVNPRGDAVVVYGGRGPQDADGVYLRHFPRGGDGSAVVPVNQTTRETQTAPSVAIDDAGRISIVWEGRGRDPSGKADQHGIWLRQYAPDLQPSSPEILVNTTIGGEQSQADIASTPDGRSVVVWSGAGASDPAGIYMQRFDASGRKLASPLGSAINEVRVNQQTNGQQVAPSVAMANDGSFVITWSSRHQDGSGWGVYYRIYNSNGSPRTDETLASSTPLGSQFRSRVGIDGQGNFAIAWTGFTTASSWDIYFRQFDRFGTARGLERQVNSRVAGYQRDPDLSMADDGRFAISWTSGDPNATGPSAGSGWNVYARLFDANGVAISDESALGNSSGGNAGHQKNTAVAIGTGPILVGSWSGRGGIDRGGVWIDDPNLDPRPRFSLPVRLTLPEQQTVRFPLHSEVAYPEQEIAYRLDPFHQPRGMVIDPNTHHLLWTPTEADGPGRYEATVIAYDAAFPTIQTSQRVEFLVTEVNQPPGLSAIAPIEAKVGQEVRVPLRASDPDLPANRLSYQIVSPTNLNMAISALSSEWIWKADASQAGKSIPVVVQVQDDGTPSLASTTTFTIHVAPLSDPPILQTIGDQTLDEGTSLSLLPVASDPIDPQPNWRFAWTSTPSIPGIQLDPDTGHVQWQTSEVDGPISIPLELRVENRNFPGRFAVQRWTTTVREVNEPPTLHAISNHSVLANTSVSFVATARDSDIPINTLRYQLTGANSTNATLDPVTGRFLWTPTQAGQYPFTIRVTDNGVPSKSSQQSFTIAVGEVLQPPRFNDLPSLQVPELQTLRHAVTATPSRTGQRLRYRLPDPPIGMVIDSTSGLLTWRPNEAQGPSLQQVVIEAYDVDFPALVARSTLEISVLEVNVAPQLSSLATITVEEGTQISTLLQATDSDVPSNILTYVAAGPLPLGASLSSTGLFEWKPTEDQGPRTWTIPLRVIDNGEPALSHQRTLTIIVREANSPPLVSIIPDQVIEEESVWSYAIQAEDTDLPIQALSFSLDAASMQAGLTIDANGVMRWTPSEIQGPSTREVVVSVRDGDATSVPSTRRFQMRVTEVNRPPVLGWIPDQDVEPGQRFRLSLAATDPDLPSNGLRYQLTGPAPVGLTLNEQTGDIDWLVPRDALPEHYVLRAVVTDTGQPALQDSQEFILHVRATLVEMVESTRFSTLYEQPITIAPGTQSLRFRIADLRFDESDSDSINDAFELALLDASHRPLVGIIARHQDAFFNITEGRSPLLGAGTVYNSTTGEVTVDVRHLPAGTEALFVARLVNNDQDDTTRVLFDERIQPLTTGVSSSLVTPNLFHREVVSTSFTSAGYQLETFLDVSSFLTFQYEATSLDRDTQTLTAMMTVTNRGEQAIRGPLLVAFSHLSIPEASVVQADGFLPLSHPQYGLVFDANLQGAAYYDLTRELSLSNQGHNGSLASGDTLRIPIRFANTSLQRFDYHITALGRFNAPPTLPPFDFPDVLIDDHFTVTLEAEDPDGDELTYEIVSGPDGLSVDGESGELSWNTDSSDAGNHEVKILIVDSFGNTTEVDFEVQVLVGNHPNHPPAFVTEPIIEASVGTLYVYPSLAKDPDGDVLRYRLLQGPLGMALDNEDASIGGSRSGVMRWTPSAQDVGKSVRVTVEADDARSGSTTQSFQIFVSPLANNLPPVFVTTPSTTFRIPELSLGTSLGPVAPLGIQEWISRGDSVSRDASLQLPPDFQIAAADIAFVVDESGSMGEHLWIESMIADLDNNLKSRGIHDVRYGIVGFGALQPEPHLVTDTPDHEVWLYGPTGGLIQRSVFAADQPMRLFPTIAGKYSMVVTRKGRDPITNQLPIVIPYMDYGFTTEFETTSTLNRVGFGIREGTTKAQQTTVVGFTANAGDIVFVDSLIGASTTVLQLYDAYGSAIAMPWLGNQDSGILSIPATGNYEIRMTDREDNAFRFHLRQPFQETKPLLIGSTQSSLLPDPNAVEIYSFEAEAGSLLHVDRLFQSDAGGMEDEILETYLVDIVLPDGSVIASPPTTGNDLLTTKSLDISAQYLPLSGSYRLLVRRNPSVSFPSIAYSFRPELLNTNAVVQSLGTSVTSQLPSPTASITLAYDLEAGDSISLNIASALNGSAHFRFLDSHGLLLHEGSMTTGTAFSHSTIRTKGRYYLVVEGAATNTSPMQFSFTLSKQGKQVVEAYQGASLPWNQRLEVNNASHQASKYLLHLNQGDRFTLSVNADNRLVKLRAPSGGIVWQDQRGPTSDALVIPTPGLLVAHVSGTYVLELESSATSTYSVQANFVGSQTMVTPALYQGRLQPTDSIATFEWNGNQSQTLVLERVRDLRPFVDAESARSRALALQTNGEFEDGYQALRYAVDHLPFRDRVDKHIVLLTDEDRDPGSSDTFESLRNLLSQEEIQLHSFLRLGMQSSEEREILGASPHGSAMDVYFHDGNGGFEQQLAQDVTIVSAAGTSKRDYFDLSINLQGSNWDISQLRGDQNTQQGRLSKKATTAAFVEEISQRTESNSIIHLRASRNVAPIRIAEGRIDGNAIRFPIELFGDGDAWNFDLEFFDPQTPNIILGSIPVAIGAGYRYDFNATDPELDPLRYRLVESSTQGIRFDETHRYLTLAPTQAGNYPVSIQVLDPWGGIDTQTWSIAVNAGSTTNLSPVVDPVANQVHPAARQLQFAIQASDADADLLTYQLIADPTNGQRPPLGMMLDPGTGLLTWTPREEQVGVHPIAVRVVDGHGGSAVASFSIRVQHATLPENRSPVILSQPPLSVLARDRYRYPLEARDVDLDVLKYSLAIGPRGMSIDRETGEIAWVTSDGDVGAHPVLVRVLDPFGGVVLQEFSIQVAPRRPLLITSRPEKRVPLRTQYEYPVQVEQHDPTAKVQFMLRHGPNDATIDEHGVLRWMSTTPGQATFAIQVTNSNGDTDQQTFEVLAYDLAKNGEPVILGDMRSSIRHSLPFVWRVETYDPDWDPVQVALEAAPLGMRLDPAGFLVWTPTPAQSQSASQPHSIRLVANDGRGGVSRREFFLRVENDASNHPPQISGEPLLNSFVNYRYRSSLQASDADQDTLFWSLLTAPQGMQINANGELTWRPSIEQVGSHEVLVQVADAYGGWDREPFLITVRHGNSPAKIEGQPPSKHRRSTEYTVDFQGVDPEGDAVQFELLQGPNNASLDKQTGQLRWTPTLNGTYAFRVAARDSFGDGESIAFQVVVDTIGNNQPPRFLDSDPGVAEIGILYHRLFAAIDPDGDTLRYSLLTKPNGMTIDSAGRVRWNPDSQLNGRNVPVSIQVMDSLSQKSTLNFQLPVRFPNRAPEFTSQPGPEITAGQIYRYRIETTDLDGDPIQLALLQAPAGVQLNAKSGELTWATNGAPLGTTRFSISASDGRVTMPVVQQWEVLVNPDILPPTLFLDIPNLAWNLGDSDVIQLRGFDNVAIDEFRLLINGRPTDLDSQQRYRWQPSRAGQYVFEGFAKDAAGNETSLNKTVIVRDPNNAAPQVSIVSLDGKQPLTQPAEVRVDIRDEERDLTEVTLQIRADGATTWETIGRLQAEAGGLLPNLVNHPIGTIDTTRFANGDYFIRVGTLDAGFNRSERIQRVTIAGRLKLGNLNLTFTDLELPVAGIPISVRRTYDSWNTLESGELGFGWSLEVARSQITVLEDTLGSIGSGRHRGFIDGSRIIVKLPDGTEEGFTFQARPGNQALGIVFDWLPGFLPDPTNLTRLEMDSDPLVKFNDEYQTGEGITFNPQDPKISGVYKIKTLDRLTHYVPAIQGQTISIEDRNGNKITLRDEGVFSNRGRAVLFGRDHLDRITRITDPRGNSVQYEYSAGGDLIAIVDRVGNRTTISYHADQPHFLHQITDANGAIALTAKYQAGDRRLLSLADPLGASTTFEYDESQRKTTVRSPLGSTQSNTRDEHGNIIETKSVDGTQTLFRYDDPASGLANRIQRVVGTPDSSTITDDFLTIREFNELGQLVKETDPRGLVTRYTYDSRGLPASSTEPSGLTKYYLFDAKENLTTTWTSAGSASRMRYDNRGNPIEVVSNFSSGAASDFGGNLGHSNQGGSPGVTTLIGYNDFGDMISTQQGTIPPQFIEYDANGNRISAQFDWVNPFDATQRQLVRSSATLNANDRISQSTTPLRQFLSSLNVFDQPTALSDDSGNRTETTIDVAGRTIRTRGRSWRNAPTSSDPSAMQEIWVESRQVFDSQGRLQYSMDALAEDTPISEWTGTRQIYDSAGRVIATEKRRGIDIRITGTPGQYRATLVAAGTLLEKTQVAYDSQGRVSRSTDSYGAVTEYAYDRWEQPIESRSQTIDETGRKLWRVTRTQYDAFGRVLVSTDPYLTPLTQAIGSGDSPPVLATLNHYDASGRDAGSYRATDVVVRIQNGTVTVVNRGTLLSQAATQYDDRGLAHRRNSIGGLTTMSEFDAHGREVVRLGPLVEPASVGLTDPSFANTLVRWREEFTYTPYGKRSMVRSNLIQAESSDGKVLFLDDRFASTTRQEHNALGQLVKSIGFGGATENWEYNDLGQVAAEVSPLGNRKSFTYDPTGRLQQVTLPMVAVLGQSSSSAPTFQYHYDHRGQLRSMIDANGHETNFEYDVQGRQLSRTLPAGQVERFTYDSRGRQSLTITFEGVHIAKVFDDSPNGGGRLSEVRYFANSTDYQNGNGTPLERTRFVYDAFGRIVAREIHRGANGVERFTTVYDFHSRVTAETTPNGTLHYRYDELGRRIRMWLAAEGSDDAAEAMTDIEYQYNAIGQLQRIITHRRDGVEVDASTSLPGNQPEMAEYKYDLFGRERAIHLPNDLMELLAYDTSGRVTLKRHVRKEANTLEPAEYPLVASFAYDYDSDRNPTTNAPSDNRVYALTESFAYDHDADPTTPSQLRTNRYEWDYDSNGRLTRERLDSWDDRLDRIQTYRFDLFGNQLESTIDRVSPAEVDEVIRYTYNANDQLVSSTRDFHGDGTIDRVTEWEWRGTQQIRERHHELTNANQLALTEVREMTYHLQGGLQQVLVHTLAEDGRVRERRLYEYAYTPDGHRYQTMTSRDLHTETATYEPTEVRKTKMIVDARDATGHEQVIQTTTFDAQGNYIERRSYVFGKDELSQTTTLLRPSGEISASTTLVFGHDAGGSVRVLYDLEGNGHQTFHYSAYGELQSLFDAKGERVADTLSNDLARLALTDLLYRGESYDSGIQRQFLRARWYSPEQARFTTLDPFAGDQHQPLTFNKYAYTSGNPISYSDPTGWFEGGLGGLIGGMSARSMMSIGMRIALPIFTFHSLVRHEGLKYPIARLTVAQANKAMIFGKLANAAYLKKGDNSEFQILENHYGWKKLEAVQDKFISGYRSVLFQNMKTNQAVVSFSGTDDLPDVFTDIVQGLIGPTRQFRIAYVVAENALIRFRNVEFTGHSLGGGLASFAALTHNSRATTFNAAGLNSLSLTIYGKSLAAAPFTIDAFRVRGEFLSTIQNMRSAYMVGALFPFPFNLALGLLGLAGFMAPDGVGKDYWLQETSFDIFTRHKMPEVFMGIRKSLA